MNKELIKEYVELFDFIIEDGKEIKKEYDNEEIRIGTSYITGGHQATEYYYYDPVTAEVSQGAVFLGNGSNYRYKNIGDIEILVLRNSENDFIRISRVIQPYDEDMAYSDQYEKAKFNQNLSEEEYQVIREQKMNDYELYQDNDGYILECINCDRKYLSIPQLEYNNRLVEDGKVCFLNKSETELICSKCTENMTIEEFLQNENDKNNPAVNKYKRYLLNYVRLEKSDKIFVN